MKCSASSSILAGGKEAFLTNESVIFAKSTIRQDNGHYVAFRKIQGNWHLLDDDKKVKQIQDEELTTQGQLFFLRRRE